MPRPAALLVLVVVAAMTALCAQAVPVLRAPVDDDVVLVEARLGDASSEGHHRVRRQNGEVVESIFQIPISTLQAVSSAFKTGIQTFQRGREQFFQATSNRPGGNGGLNAAYNYQQTNGLSSINYQQTNSKPSSAYSPYKPAYNPYKPYKPAAAFSQSQAQAQAYAVLNRPGYVLYNYSRPRAAGQTNAAAVAGVAAQGDGSSYRI